MIKKLLSILIVICLVTVAMSVSVRGFNIRVDGLADEKVWLDSHTQVLVSERNDSNNAVSFALANVLYDEEKHRVYLSVKANVDSEISITSETSETLCPLHALLISVDNSDFVEVSCDGVGLYNETLYYIEGAVSEYSSSSFGVEVCLGIKLGLHTLKSIVVQLVDSNGIPSNAYTLDLPALPSEETTTVYLPGFDESTAQNPTGNNTDSITSTKRTTTEKITKPVKTTSQKTTKPKTTKEKTTKLKTTKVKTTAKVVTVYATVPIYIETTVNNATVSELTSEQIQSEKTYKELKYAAAVGLLIMIFGLCVIINMLNDKNRSEKK